VTAEVRVYRKYYRDVVAMVRKVSQRLLSVISSVWVWWFSRCLITCTTSHLDDFSPLWPLSPGWPFSPVQASHLDDFPHRTPNWLNLWLNWCLVICTISLTWMTFLTCMISFTWTSFPPARHWISSIWWSKYISFHQGTLYECWPLAQLPVGIPRVCYIDMIVQNLKKFPVLTLDLQVQSCVRKICYISHIWKISSK